MAIPLLIAAYRAQPVPAGAAGLYRPGGAHRPLAAAASIAIAGGIGAALMLALVVPDLVATPTILTGAHVPVATPIEPPEADPAPQPSTPATSILTAPTPRFDAPRTAETPAASEVFEPSQLTILPGPEIKIGAPTAAVEPPRTPLFVAATRDPAFARRFQPSYPPQLERQGIEGRCRVTVTIAPAGTVSAVANAGCDHADFFSATQRQALRSWRFKPATRDGVAVESTQDVGVVFRVPDEN